MLMAALPLSLASCAEELEYTPGEIPDGAQVFFPVDTPTEYTISEETSISIPVKRAVTDEALTVEILPNIDEANKSLFTIPSSVSFDAGSGDASLTVSFSDLAEDTEYEIGLMINDEANTTPYGYNTLYITLVKPSPWKNLGNGTWYENGYFGFEAPVEVPIFQSEVNPNNFRIQMSNSEGYLYSAASSEYFEFSVLQPGETLNGVTVTLEGLVYFSPFDSGIENTNYGETVWFYHPALFPSMATESAWTYNKVVQFQENGLPASVQCAPMYYLQQQGGGWDYSQQDGVISIVFPGAELSDYSLSAEYTGMRVASDNTTVSAVIDFTYGADVASISYAFVAGDITSAPDEVISSIADGTAENVATVDDLDDSGKISVEAVLEPGIYTVVALPAGESGEFSTSDAAVYQFYFPGIGGTEIPECEIQTMLAYVSDVMPDYSSRFPDYSSLALIVAGSEISSAMYYLNSTSVLEGLSEEEISAIIAEYGYSFDSEEIGFINSGGLATAFSGLNSGTSYTIWISATNLYGKSAMVSSTLSTTDAPASSSQKSNVKEVGMNGYNIMLVSEAGRNLILPVKTSVCDPLPKNMVNNNIHISETRVPFQTVK